MAGLFAATAAEAEGTSQHGLSGPQAANKLCVQELVPSEALPPGTGFTQC